jgi:hypothetical protein
MSWSGTVTCSYCYSEGHNRRGCDKLKEFVRDNPDSWQATRAKRNAERATTRKCSYCKHSGHNRKTCLSLKRDILNACDVNAEWRTRVRDHLTASGLGVGALVRFKDGWSDEYTLGLVQALHWDDANFLAHDDGSKGAFVRVVPLKYFGERGRGAILRPMAGCEGFEESRWGSNRIHEVVSPVSSSAVEGQIPARWLDGSSGVGAMFDDECVGSYRNPSDKMEELAKGYGIELRPHQGN